jgi:hypothetical protein
MLLEWTHYDAEREYSTAKMSKIFIEYDLEPSGNFLFS